MSGERYAEQARRWVRAARPEAPPRLPSDRHRLVGAVQGALRTRRRKRMVVRSVTVLGAAAAALALVLTRPDVHGHLTAQAPAPAPAKASTHARDLTVVRANTDGSSGIALGEDVVKPVRRGMMLQPGIQLVAPNAGDVQIGTAQGTLLTLEPGGTLTVTEATETQRFALLRGAVRARVTKLAPGERFLINSVDAEIEVHGTQFRVALVEGDAGCAVHSTTRVSVTEGVVSVRSAGQEVRLHPGEEWPAGCAPVRVAAEVAKPAAPVRIARRSKAPGHTRHMAAEAPSEAPEPSVEPATEPAADHTTAPAPTQPPPVRTIALPAPGTSAPVASEARPPASAPPVGPVSQLKEQNDLFAAAYRAKREGRETDAIRLLTRLVRRFPDGIHVESALAERMKLLAVGDATAGADAASEYLSHYPSGFARADAERLVARSAAARKP